MFAALLALASSLMGGAALADSHEPPTGRVQTPLVTDNAPVSTADQRRLGLVTVAGCSGTLLNRFWVLTADHCVATDGMAGGPGAMLASLPVSATWSPVTAVPTRVVRSLGGRDAALLYLGALELGAVDLRLIEFRRWETGLPLVKFGQGMNRLATGSGPANAVPASGDGQYERRSSPPRR